MAPYPVSMGIEGNPGAFEVADPAGPSSGLDRTFGRWPMPAAIGFAPVLLLLLTWVPAGDWSAWQWLVRSRSLAIVGTELFVIAIAVREGLFARIIEQRWPRLVVAAASGLLAIAVTTAAIAPNPLEARTLTAFWIVHALFGLAVLHLCGRQLRPVDLIRCYLAGFALFTLLFALFVLQVPDPARFNWTKALPAATHIRHLGYYAAAALGLAGGLMAVAERRSAWAGAFAVAVLATALAFWTGSRGTIAAAAGGLVAGLVVVPGIRRLRCWIGLAGSAVLGAALAYWLPSPAANMGFARTLEATAGDNVATGRTEMWRIVLEAIRERPLFGYGEGQMHDVATYSTMIQPHNVLLQTTLAWGAVGTLCLLILALAYARRVLPAVRVEGALIAPSLAMAMLAAFSLFDGALFHPLPVSIFAACAGLLAHGAKRVAK